MIMPYTLSVSRLIALKQHDSVTSIGVFHSQRDGFCGFLDPCRNPNRQIIEVLKMRIGYNEDVPSILRPLTQCNESCNAIVLIHDIGPLHVVMLVLDAAY